MYSHLSGITLLGVPTEVYYYGTQYLFISVVNVVVIFVVLHIYLPVFYELQITSVYEVCCCVVCCGLSAYIY